MLEKILKILYNKINTRSESMKNLVWKSGANAPESGMNIVNQKGFTLAEMMVVMLIMSIILAAMAPVMTTRNKSDYSSPWRYSPRNNSDAYFGAGDNQVALLGQSDADDAERDTKFLIRTAANSGFSHILFKTGESIVGRLYFDESNLFISNTNPSSNTGSNNTTIGVDAFMNNTSGSDNSVIGYNALTSNTTGAGNVAIGSNTLQNNRTGNHNIAIGFDANFGNLPENLSQSISIGSQTTASESGSIAIGASAISSADSSTSIGRTANAQGTRSIAIGSESIASNQYSIALGDEAETHGDYSLALGSYLTKAYGENSIAIGNEAQAGSGSGTGTNSIVIGSSASSSNINSVVIGNSATTKGSGSIVIGSGASYEENVSDGIVIGHGATVSGSSSGQAIAIGASVSATGGSSIAIGSSGWNDATSSARLTEASAQAIAIGDGAVATGLNSIALGSATNARGENNIAIGFKACENASSGANVVCIGPNSGPAASKVRSNTIYLGNETSTVYIPGDLVVGGTSVLGADSKSSRVFVRADGWFDNYVFKMAFGGDVMGISRPFVSSMNPGETELNNGEKYYSDRRLKYVGKENTSGLDKIRQLKVFNYTFKKDEKKTPHVGVIAQDLQKVFPDAVKKGVDGFLTIRMEDMFYAVINAIKELDSRVTALEKENQGLKARIERLEAKIK